MISKEEIKKELRYIEKLEFNGVANYEHANAIKKALNYYLEMNGATKEEIRAERDIEIVEMLEGEISYSQEMNILGSEDTRIEVLKEIKEWIEENK